MFESDQVIEPPRLALAARATPFIGPKDALARAQNTAEYCGAWLAFQCEITSGARAGLLLLDDGDGHFSTAAVWPSQRHDLSYLADAAQEALKLRKVYLHSPVAASGSAAHTHLGQPIEWNGRLKGVVVLDVEAVGEITAAIRQLQWGIGWLELLFARQQIEADQTKTARTNATLQILADVHIHASFQGAAIAVADTLASRLACSRVSVGLWNGRTVRVKAMSHTAVFSQKSHLVAAIESAMEEAADQHASVAVPPTESTGRRIALATEALAKISGAQSIATVLMMSGSECVGVILLERDRGDCFDDGAIAMIEMAATFIGPELKSKSDSNRLIAGRAVTSASSFAKAFFGPGRPALKAGVITAAIMVAYLAIAHGEFRVSAKAVVEGALQRAIVAPFDGYIAKAFVRAGDIVDEGQPVAALDDRELKLETARWNAEREQQLIKYGEAMAKHDRSAALIASAALEQTEAQLALVESKLVRAHINAPFKGVVVSGDLSQLQGTPIEKGKTLFEIAPLESYRVILQVDERDISFVLQGQQGTLVLTGLSSEATPIAVKKVTPVATASEGRNHFRVEADVQGAGDKVRPGMEGIGKITIDRRPLIAIWSRSLLDWIRISLWKWLP